MSDTDLQARVDALEQKLGAMVSRWNDFVGGEGAITRPRFARLEQRFEELLEAHNEGVETRKKNAEINQETLVEVVKKIGDAFKQLAERMDAVEERGIRFCGVYQRAVTYGRGDVVVSDGSLWCALADSEGVKPGTDEKFWQLCVKSAR